MRPVVPIAVLTLALAAGCGPTASPSAGAPAAGGGPTSAGGARTSAGRSPGADGAGPQCPADADITKTLGITVTNDNDPVRSGTTSVVCGYNGKRADGGGTAVQVHMVIGRDAKAEYDGLKTAAVDQHYTTSDRSGIGDEAFTFANSAYNVNFLVVLKGDKVVDISAQATVDKEVDLASLVFAG
jgi:hypothetical protein